MMNHVNTDLQATSPEDTKTKKNKISNIFAVVIFSSIYNTVAWKILHLSRYICAVIAYYTSTQNQNQPRKIKQHQFMLVSRIIIQNNIYNGRCPTKTHPSAGASTLRDGASDLQACRLSSDPSRPNLPVVGWSSGKGVELGSALCCNVVTVCVVCV